MAKQNGLETLLHHPELKGRWVAVDPSEYDESGEAVAGSVIDADMDLGALCGRLAESRSRCAIVFCPDEPG